MAAYTPIDDSSAYFQATLYNGDSNNSTVITNTGNSNLQPDFIWIKSRNHGNAGTGGHMWFDSSRGIKSTTGSDSPFLVSNSTSGDQTNANGLQAVGTNSFTPGSMTRTNETGDNYVAWQWKMNGGTTSSNSDGGYTTTVQVNSDAGMSIVTYTGSGGNSPTATTIGHGLGAVPKFIIIRARNRTENWHVFHYSAGTGGFMLDSNTAHNNNSVLGDTLPTSSVYKLGTDLRMNGGYNYVAYCFADVQGYSKFGAYYGNGQHVGPFIHTGFKPGLIIVKQEDSTEPWVMFDYARNPFNITNNKLCPHSPAAENGLATTDDGSGQYNFIDVCSNGFKCRHNSAAVNGNGARILYAAWAQNPFVTSGGVAGTAK